MEHVVAPAPGLTAIVRERGNQVVADRQASTRAGPVSATRLDDDDDAALGLTPIKEHDLLSSPSCCEIGARIVATGRAVRRR